MNACPTELELVQWLDGELTENRSAQVRDHVAACGACADAAEALRKVAAQLAAVPSADDPAFLAEVLARTEAAPPRARRSRRHFALATGGLSLAAGIALALAKLPEPAPTTFAARGTEPAWQDLAGIEVWVAPLAGQAPRHHARPGETLAPGAALAFRVTKGMAPLCLALFAVDARGDVHWFHPAWTDSARPPRSIELGAGAGTFPLPDDVAPDGAAPGPLRVHALFSTTPLDVRAIEAAVHAGRFAEVAPDVRLQVVELRYGGEP